MAFEFDSVGLDSGKLGAALKRGVLMADMVEEGVGGHDIQWIGFGVYGESVWLLAAISTVCLPVGVVLSGEIVMN